MTQSPLKNLSRSHSITSLFQKYALNLPLGSKYEESFKTDEYQLVWEKIYLLPLRATLSTKLREFQYKILNRILYTNDMLFKFKKLNLLCVISAKTMSKL